MKLTQYEWEVIHAALKHRVEIQAPRDFFLCTNTTDMLQSGRQISRDKADYIVQTLLHPLLRKEYIQLTGSWYHYSNAFWVSVPETEQGWKLNQARLAFWERHKANLIG